MVGEIKYNFSSKEEYKRDLWQCPEGCGAIDSQEHVVTKCVAFTDLRNKLDMNDDEDIVTFFKKVIGTRQSKQN